MDREDVIAALEFQTVDRLEEVAVDVVNMDGAAVIQHPLREGLGDEEELVDRVELVTNEESFEFARRLAKEEGIISGISCGAAAAVAVRLAGDPEFKGKTIVTVLPDSGERYLSTPLFEA